MLSAGAASTDVAASWRAAWRAGEAMCASSVLLPPGPPRHPTATTLLLVLWWLERRGRELALPERLRRGLIRLGGARAPSLEELVQL
jgi:hypothetical protein